MNFKQKVEFILENKMNNANKARIVGGGPDIHKRYKRAVLDAIPRGYLILQRKFDKMSFNDFKNFTETFIMSRGKRRKKDSITEFLTDEDYKKAYEFGKIYFGSGDVEKRGLDYSRELKVEPRTIFKAFMDAVKGVRSGQPFSYGETIKKDKKYKA